MGLFCSGWECGRLVVGPACSFKYNVRGRNSVTRDGSRKAYGCANGCLGRAREEEVREEGVSVAMGDQGKKRDGDGELSGL